MFKKGITRKDTQQGLSLLDLMVSLTLFAIILGAFVLNNSSVKSSARIETQTLLGVIDTYAYLAIKNHSDYYIEFNEKNLSYKIFNNPFEDQINTIKQKALSAGIKFSSVNFGTLTPNNNSITSNTLALRADASASPGSVSLKSKNNTCTIIQTLRGARRFVCTNN